MIDELASIGSPHRHYSSTDSTNERARTLAIAGASSGTVVTATKQSAGRGRYGRSWEAPPGKALLYSAILRPPAAEHPLLSLLAALATAEAIESAAAVRCEIKWPNDVWIEERKVAGILIESRPSQWAVVGIGINVSVEPEEFPEDLRWPAISVKRGASVQQLRLALNSTLTEWLRAPHSGALAAYRSRDALSGREVEWTRSEASAALAGTAAGIDDAGNLTLRGPDGILTVSSGEVQLRAAQSEASKG